MTNVLGRENKSLIAMESKTNDSSKMQRNFNHTIFQFEIYE